MVKITLFAKDSDEAYAEVRGFAHDRDRVAYDISVERGTKVRRGLYRYKAEFKMRRRE